MSFAGGDLWGKESGESSIAKTSRMLHSPFHAVIVSGYALCREVDFL